MNSPSKTRGEARIRRVAAMMAGTIALGLLGGCMSSPSSTVNLFEEFQEKSGGDGSTVQTSAAIPAEVTGTNSEPASAPGETAVAATDVPAPARGDSATAYAVEPEAASGADYPGSAGLPAPAIQLGDSKDGEVLAYALPGLQETPVVPGAQSLQEGSPVVLGELPRREQAAAPGTDIASLDMPALPGTGQAEGDVITGLTGNTPQIDPEEYFAKQRIATLYSQIDNGKCRGGFGPKPKKINAMRVTPGDPYYIEIRMRQTPLMPVGHTYVAYGDLGPDGNPVNENLIMLAPYGGYAGAALASGVPMPGVLKPHPDDCRIRPEAAYRVSLDAKKYEHLLRAVKQAKDEVPQYLLFTQNCNHFASRIAKSVGIRPPANIYVPALSYIYDMIEANEGYKVTDRFYDPRSLGKFPAVPGKASVLR